MTADLPEEGGQGNRAAGGMLAAAFDYLDRGSAIVPQRAGDKKPSVRWKPLQERLPTREEVTDC
jgi:hypothetical protein